MNGQMTEKMAQVWSSNVGSLYIELSRNPDKSARDQFKIDREVRGTKAWAVCEAQKMRNPSVILDDETCDLILEAIK